MSWLPCLRRGSDRWWLPLSCQSGDALAATLVAGAGDRRRVASLQDQLRRDPPLLIFAALATCCGDGSQQRQLNLGQLAEELSARLTGLLADGPSLLGAPAAIDDQPEQAGRESLMTQWDRLRGRFWALPRSQWLSAAADWLELTGPPVPADWRGCWPEIIGDPEDCSEPRQSDISYAPSQLDLAALARTIRRGQRLENSFEDHLHAAKRSALKQFAYGLSHEINNPLANISTRAQTLLRGEPDPGRGKSLQRIIDQTTRAHEMVADLMFYAHPPPPQPGSVDLQQIVQAVAKESLAAVQGRGIAIVVSPASESLTLVADRGMLIEAVRALVRNAIEAIGCDGKIELNCQRFAAAEPSLARPLRANRSDGPAALLASGPTDSAAAAMITVSDSGPGLSDAARLHAFDPYFSGREAGRGLGVGLCRVQRIAELHGGDVALHSGPAGCTARFWIPLPP